LYIYFNRKASGVIDRRSFCKHVLYGGKCEINKPNPLLAKIDERKLNNTFFEDKWAALPILYAKDKDDRVSIKIAEGVFIVLG
jgi:hypothetical protein